MQDDSPLRWVRKNVFGVTQDALADIGGVSRPRVSRYENRAGNPPFEFMERVRAEARRLGKPFSADWFFEVPADLVVGAAPSLDAANAVREVAQ